MLPAPFTMRGTVNGPLSLPGRVATSISRWTTSSWLAGEGVATQTSRFRRNSVRDPGRGTRYPSFRMPRWWNTIASFISILVPLQGPASGGTSRKVRQDPESWNSIADALPFVVPLPPGPKIPPPDTPLLKGVNTRPPSIHGMQPHSLPRLRRQGARTEGIRRWARPAAGIAHSSQFRFTGKEVFQTIQRHIQPVVHSQFAEQLMKVDFHGAFGDPQRKGDLLILEALRHQRDNLSLALGQGNALLEQYAVHQFSLEAQYPPADILQRRQQCIHPRIGGEDAVHTQLHRLKGELAGQSLAPQDNLAAAGGGA